MSSSDPTVLPVQRIAELKAETESERWLVAGIWGHADVGIIGGAPKCCKSYLGLDMALSVATGTPMLDHFAVERAGPVLIYLAEDALPAIRARVEGLCLHRRLELDAVDLHVITTPTLRLDRATDQKRLQATIASLKPHLLVLDPLVRLHQLDENSSADISKLLGYLRALQRTFDMALVLVHHASKKHRAQPGQALRGSSDLHAFGDSNAYLSRHGEQLTLTLEQRSARPPEPMRLELTSRPDGSATHLRLLDGPALGGDTTEPSLLDRLIVLLETAPGPLTRTAIRTQLRVNNNRLGDVLKESEKAGRIRRDATGWCVLRPAPEPTQPSLF